MDVHRAYKVLGLLPGTSKEEVRGAYRDLVQVWHPDRYSHNERLQQKAQRNLKRINEAFEILKEYEPPPGGVGRQSLLSTTFSAIQDIGDIMQTGAIERPQPRPRQRQRDVVLGAEDVLATGFVRTRRRTRGKRRVGKALTLLAVAALVVVAIVLVLMFLV